MVFLTKASFPHTDTHTGARTNTFKFTRTDRHAHSTHRECVDTSVTSAEDICALCKGEVYMQIDRQKHRDADTDTDTRSFSVQCASVCLLLSSLLLLVSLCRVDLSESFSSVASSTLYFAFLFHQQIWSGATVHASKQRVTIFFKKKIHIPCTNMGNITSITKTHAKFLGNNN